MRDFLLKDQNDLIASDWSMKGLSYGLIILSSHIGDIL